MVQSEPDFKAVFEQAPVSLLLLDADLMIIAASDAYLRDTMTTRADIIGRDVFDAFPDNPDDPHATGQANIRASFDRVRRFLVADTVPVQRYDIRRPECEGGGFELRYWSPVNAPVFGRGGDLACIVHRVQDVTEYVRFPEPRDTRAVQLRTKQMEAEIFARARELGEANRRLRRLAAIVEQADDAIITKTRDGVITSWNRGAQQLYGYGEAEVLGKPAALLAPPGREHESAQLIGRVVSSGRVYQHDTVRVGKNGQPVEVSLCLTPLLDAAGEVSEVLTIARDITDRRRAEAALAERTRQLEATNSELGEQQSYTRSLIEASVDALMTTDPQGVITDVNKQMETLTGFVRGELIGTEFKHYVTDPERAERGIRTVLRDQRVTDYELTARHRSGRQTPVSYNAATFYDRNGDLRGVFAAARDITERRIAEDRLRHFSWELEARVAERTRQLEDANRELEAFTYTVSHDLRAPLRAMDGFSKLLSQDCPGQLDEQGKHYLTRIRSGAQRMGTMIDELLQLSRVGRSDLRRETVDVTLLARQVAAELAQEAPQRRVEFVISDGMTARADPHLLQIVLENLLSNAWKFTSTHKRARIEMGASMRDGQREFYVRDDGVGFDMAYAGQLFKPFQRLHRPEEFPGVGVGMASVQRIISRHGGRIWACAQPDRGATFTFTLSPDGADGAGPEPNGDCHESART